jgi:hypothetical protein
MHGRAQWGGKDRTVSHGWKGVVGEALLIADTIVCHRWKGTVGEAFLIARIAVTAIDGMGRWGRRKLWGR